ncbi:MAG: hypothetical protein IJ837_01335 [Clostridia bacterium]|nr:hypothetical protein [Clostridia bacterium]
MTVKRKPPTTKDINKNRDIIIKNVEETNNRNSISKYEQINFSENSHDCVAIRKNLSKKALERIEMDDRALLITGFPMNIDLRTNNLPKHRDSEFPIFNFSYGKTAPEKVENYDQMKNARKVVIAYSAHENKTRNSSFDMLQIFCLAPELKSSNLPSIYRIDLTCPKNNPESYHLRCSAIVGGAVDGLCCLGQLDYILEEDEKPKYYKIPSEHTYGKLISARDDGRVFKAEPVEEVNNIKDALRFMDEAFNVKSIYFNGGNNKLVDIMETVKKSTANGLEQFDSDEFLQECFEPAGKIKDCSSTHQGVSNFLSSPITIATMVGKSNSTKGNVTPQNNGEQVNTPISKKNSPPSR